MKSNRVITEGIVKYKFRGIHGLVFKLNEININGHTRGCSGFIGSEITKKIVYINTECNCYGPLKGSILYRLADSFDDYSSIHYNNNFCAEGQLKEQVLRLLNHDTAVAKGVWV